MTVEEVAGHFGGHGSGCRWTARCPAHPDRSPSLSIAEGRDGRVLLHCHAGCETKAILAAAGLRWADVMPPGRCSGTGTATNPEAQDAIRSATDGLRWLPSAVRENAAVTVVLADPGHIDQAIARALALAVEGVLAQIVMERRS